MNVNWWEAGATAFVLLIGLGIAAAMAWVVRISLDDSDKHAELKAFMETLFGTPAHLRADDGSGGSAGQREEAAAAAGGAPFEEPCPACGATVTHRDVDCPSCGLRLQ